MKTCGPLGFLCLSLAFGLCGSAALAEEPAGQPPARLAGATRAELALARTPVEALYGTLSSAIARGEDGNSDALYALLEPVIDSVYDLDFMASKALGRHWRKLDAPTRARWVSTFRSLTTATYATRFAEDKGQTLEVLGSGPAPRDTAVVDTRIVPAEGDPVEIRYRMHKRGEDWRIIDVYLNGTVSELALRRSEYASVIKRDGFDALVQSIEEKIENGDLE